MFSYTTITPLLMPTYAGLMLGGSSIGSTVDSNYKDMIGTSVNYSAAYGQTADTGVSFDSSGITTTKSYSITASSSNASSFSPSTVSTTVGSAAGPPSSSSYSTTYTLNRTNSGSTTESGTTSQVTEFENTKSGSSGSWGDKYGNTAGATYDTVNSGTTINGSFTTGSSPASSTTNSTQTNATRASSTARTASEPSSVEYRESYTYDYASQTTDSVYNYCQRYTTSSWTYVTGSPASTLSSWNTANTIQTAQHTVTTMDFETDALTVEGDSTSWKTEIDGDETRMASFAKTDSVFHQLEDTVYRLSDGGSEFLRGYMAWSMPHAGIPATTSYTGKFTDLYQPASGQSFTVSDYQKFFTNSLALPTITLSRAATVIQVTTGTGTGTGTETRSTTLTLTNGNAVYTTSSWSKAVSLGDIGTSASLPTGTKTATTTVFTHQVYLSGYATSGNRPFTTATSFGTWVDMTSQSVARAAWASSYTTTATRYSRAVTTDVVLASVQTVTSVTGTTSMHSFLGLSRQTTSRVIYQPITITDTQWTDGLGISLQKWASSTIQTYSTDANKAETQVISWNGSHNLSVFTKLRRLVGTYSRALYPPAVDAAWMTTPARGWAGFCGTFTQTSPAIYLTTTSGLSSGSTFDDAFPAIYVETKDLYENGGVSIVPCHGSTGITLDGIGLAQSSLISTPSGMESAVSIAATWTSTTTSGSSTLTSTKSATHTAAMLSAVTGNFWTDFPITFDSLADIGRNGPHASLGGYVAGDNRMGSHEVRVNAGAASWTEFTAGASDASGVTGETSGTDESVSFVVSQGAAVRIAVEPIITVEWVTTATTNYPQLEPAHLLTTCLHQPFLSESAP